MICASCYMICCSPTIERNAEKVDSEPHEGSNTIQIRLDEDQYDESPQEGPHMAESQPEMPGMPDSHEE